MTPAQRDLIAAVAVIGKQINPTFDSAAFTRKCEWRLAQAARKAA